MNQAQDQIITNNPGGADQRAYPRMVLTLAALCTTDNGTRRLDCKIRDFCNGGMLLTFARHSVDSRPSAGEQITIAARYPDNEQGKIARFNARVVRETGNGIGVALISPDPDALQVLVTCSMEQSGQAATAHGIHARRLDGPAAELIGTCHDLANAAIEDMARQLTTELNQAGSGFRDCNIGPAERSSLMEARERVRHARGRISELFRQSALSRVEEQVTRFHGASAALTESEDNLLTLSLVDENELDDWLFVSDLAGRIESDHKCILVELVNRLGNLCGETVNHQNNPFGPQVFVQAMLDACNQAGLAPKDRNPCFDMTRPLLSTLIGDLCRKLNTCLESAGIREFPVSMMATGSTGTEADRTAIDTVNDDAVNHRGTEDPPSDSRQLFDLVRELRRLRADHGHREQAVAPGEDHAAPVDSDTLVSLLSDLQQADDQSDVDRDPAPGGDQTTGLRQRLQSALAVRQDDASPVRIGERESAVIDLADHLFTSMLGDRLLARSVRSWIHRLEIPLLKLAIHDDTLFLDPSHVAREVINNLSRLEVYDSPEDRGRSAIHQEIDRLVETIAGDENPDEKTFVRALKKLNVLVEMQNEAYEDNLGEVLAECEREEQARVDEEAPAPFSVEHAGNPELAEWIERTRRLQVGDWLLFATDPSRPQRLRLAWISRHKDRFVFVNLRGLREATLEIPTLAKQLRQGEAVVMDSADEPALDRAQYTMLQNLHHQLLYETSHDQLTGLLNRREFERRVQETLDHDRYTGTVHLLHHVDIAQFNVINTSCGTRGGDRLLVEFCGLLVDAAGKDAIVARIGSDEFGVLLKLEPDDDPGTTANDIIRAVTEFRFRHDDQEFPIAIGIGIARTEAFDNGAECLQAAENSCRTAREQGLNKVDFYHPDDMALSEHNQASHWLARIDQALSEGSLDLRCQRILPANDGEGRRTPHHCEILLGITDDSGAFISPQDFILTAEHYQRMPAIDRWVIETTFRFMLEHPGVLKEVGGFSINISGCSLSDAAFRRFLRDLISDSGAPMDRICFEITETAGITSLSDAADFILETRRSGCLFSLDDFGSGRSSYTYLKNLPVDFLKIDGDFVSSMDENQADYAVVKSITEIGHFMGKKVIAERVENDSVLKLLQEIGVDYVQGYAVERPRRLRELL